MPAYEDVIHAIDQEARWPKNLDPMTLDLKLPDERRRVAEQISKGLDIARGFVLPLKPVAAGGGPTVWRSTPWPLRRGYLFLTAGDSPLGLRLPLSSLPWVAPEDMEIDFERDPFAPIDELPLPAARQKPAVRRRPADNEESPAREIIHTALCAEVRGGVLHLFMPPVPLLEDYVDLLHAIENTAQ